MKGISEKQFKNLCRTGAISAILVLAGILADIFIGSVTGGDISSLPQTAVGRFEQFRISPFMGLYGLDLLNVINQIILIPAIFTLFIIHINLNKSGALMAFTIFLTGTILFIAGNTSLVMYDLSNKYFAATNDTQRLLIAAAGEAMLAKGSHGGSGVFFGFFLPNLGTFLMSVVMLKGMVFSRITSWTGIAGNLLMLAYIVAVTFFDSAGSMAMMLAMPGGILIIVWTILYTKRLFKLKLKEIHQ